TSLDLSSFNTSKVTSMYGLFKNCKKLTSLDLSNLVISEETDISCMFDGCDSLKTVIMKNCSAATVRKIKAELPEGVEIIQ
uniref:BspA family leucine-rich repeat surface protein n=1 Tax=Duncaniella muris TaxID=2094150 RepID=UPI0025B09C50